MSDSSQTPEQSNRSKRSLSLSPISSGSLSGLSNTSEHEPSPKRISGSFLGERSEQSPTQPYPSATNRKSSQTSQKSHSLFGSSPVTSISSNSSSTHDSSPGTSTQDESPLRENTVIEMDVIEFAKQGFEIEYSRRGRVGRGANGAVYRGRFGDNAKNARDLNGEPLRNVETGTQFAVKFVDFGKVAKDLDKINDERKRQKQSEELLKRRESYEMERYILNFVNHKNITPFRLALNRGELRTFKCRTKTIQLTGLTEFAQHDRIYLLMDLAQLGSLAEFLMSNDEKLNPVLRMKFIRDCFWGLQYLHENHIIHGDIHVGNVLVFDEDNGICAKLTDFGEGWVDRSEPSNPHKFNDKSVQDNLIRDIYRMSVTFTAIWHRNREWEKDSEDEKTARVQIKELINFMGTASTLDVVLDKYSNILKEGTEGFSSALIE